MSEGDEIHIEAWRKRILLACGILAIGLTWALTAKRERETSYRGRTVSQWLARIDKGHWGAWDEAPIRAIGTNAIPSCLKWISYQDSPVRNRFTNFVERFSPALGRWLTRRLSALPGGRANRVVEVFRILGPQARIAIPELTRLAQTSFEPARANRCVKSLGFIGPDAIPSLLILATNSPPHTRWPAIWKLADFGTNAVAAVPALRRLD
jgi:hypothetical protein